MEWVVRKSLTEKGTIESELGDEKARQRDTRKHREAGAKALRQGHMSCSKTVRKSESWSTGRKGGRR